MEGSERDRSIEIVVRLKNGDEAAFKELYELTHNRVYFLALKVVRNHEEALEVVQETYISVYKSIDKLINPQVFNTWLSKIVINKCKDRLGKQKEVRLTENEDLNYNEGMEAIEDNSSDFIPHEMLDKSETRNMIMALIDKLPEAQRTTLMVHYYQGLNVEEIAAIMECPAATVKSRLVYARRQIKTGVEGYERQGIKLYNIAIVPLIVFMLDEFSKDNVLGPQVAAKIFSSVSAGLHVATSTVAQTAAGTSKFGVMHKFASMSVRMKIIAGAVAVTAVVTPVVVTMSRNSPVSSEISSKTSVVSTVDNRVGNTPGNIENGGFVAQQGEWIYYRNISDNDFLYKMKTDGTGKTKLSSDITTYLNVVGDWIYYQNKSDQDTIYKIRMNGTGRTKLNNDMSDHISIVGDWIYYSNLSNVSYGDGAYGYLYKIRKDGTGKTKLSDNYVSEMTVAGDWIYYENGSDKNGLYKIRTDGIGETKLDNDLSAYINILGEWIYYSNGSDNWYLYKIRTDGTGKTKLNSDSTMYKNVVGNWIYYANKGDNDFLYKIRTDGTDETKLNNENSGYINVVSDWIYYQHVSDIPYLYKMRMDGTARQLVK
jgi:RNA polymerase sigma factor (sigma-70 family)